MAMSSAQIQKLGKLCKLTLTDTEISQLAQMLTSTLDYINVLDELALVDTPETFQVTGLKNIYQKEDDAPNTLSKKEALQNASEIVKGLFATKAVFNR